MTSDKTSETHKGLQGIVAGTTAISYIDGEGGKLFYRGFSIDELAQRSNFEEVIFLLFFGRLPNVKEWASWQEDLSKERSLPKQITDAISTFPKTIIPMAALRTAVSLLGLYDKDAEDSAPSANLRKGTRLVAQMPTVVAAIERTRRGGDPIPPLSKGTLAENFLYMLHGKAPDAETVRGLDAYFVLLAEHSYNASTFAARTTAATLSDIYSAVVSAVGTLKGDLHGSANQRTMEMLLEIKESSRIVPYVKERLARKQKIMGFGHRVYKADDPRAPYLREWAQRLGKRNGAIQWFQIAEELKQVMKKEKPLPVNVDFYSAPLLYYLGIPVDLFTLLFACARTPGWAAHVLEQYSDNRLIRPDAEYSGPPLNQTYTPLEKRQ
ncbi:MAG: citrate synthase [Candidatus Omnitrophica bacterium]|nr:citrate synthase [Candidatus Omnitrophota bacterium]